jgi:hypothetical protein
VIGHDALHRDAAASEPGEGALDEGDRALLALVGQDLGRDKARGMVDLDVPRVPADAAVSAHAPAPTGDAMADQTDPAGIPGSTCGSWPRRSG